jgi:hypothetical protein
VADISVTSDSGTTAVITTSQTVNAAVSSPTPATFGVSGALAGPIGATGAAGATGATGAPGIGVPTGGSTGQVLAKASGTNYDTAWTAASGGVDVTAVHLAGTETVTGDKTFQGAVTVSGTELDLASSNVVGTGGTTLDLDGDVTLTGGAGLSVTDGNISVADGNISVTTGDITTDGNLTAEVVAFSRSTYQAELLQNTSGDRTISVIKAPTASPEEATMTTMLDYGSGNTEFVDWTIEDYAGVDHKASINVGKAGTGSILPFVIRTWDSDAGVVASVGKEYFTITPGSEVVINESSQDVNFRVESDTNANALFVDAGLSRVGVGTGSPAEILHVYTTDDYATMRFDSGSGATGGYFYADNAFGFVVVGSRTATDVLLMRGGSEKLRLTATGVTVTGTLTVPTPSNGTDAASKSYVDTAVTGLLDFKGSTDASANPNYPAASKGDAYVISVAGKIGGASGTSVDIGDVYLATADNAGGTQASVGTSWSVLEHNLVGALLSANNLSDLASASTARTNLGLGTAAVVADSTLVHLAGTETITGPKSFNLTGSSGSSITSVAVDADNASTGGAIGVDVSNVTATSGTVVGQRIAAPSGGTANYALQLSDTGGTSAGGITFGTDTNLYRIAADRGASDDSWSVAGNLTAGSTGTSGGFRLRVIGPDVNGLRIDNTGASGSGGGAGIQAVSNDGAAMASGERLGFFVFGGAFDSASSTGNSAGMIAFTSEAWDSTHRGAELRFETTPNGATARAVALTIGQDKSLTLADAGNIAFGTSTGTKIGTATTQKLGFYNSTPIVQPTGSIKTALTNLGLVGTPTIPAADISAGALANTMTATTQSINDNSTNLATTGYVDRMGPGGVGSVGFIDDFLTNFGSGSITTATGINTDQGWIAVQVAGGTQTVSSSNDASFTNPGQLTVNAASAVSGQGLALFQGNAAGGSGILGALGSNAGWDLHIIVKLSQTTLCSIRFGVAKAGQAASDSPTDGMYFEYNTANTGNSDTKYTAVTRSASTSTYTTTNQIAADTSFHHFRIRSTVTGTIRFSVDGGTEDAVSTNVSTANMTPFFQIITRTTAAKSAVLDYFSYLAATGRT